METKQFIEKQIRLIEDRVGDQKAIVACSGGVDSTVCTILAHRALSDKLLAVFIDSGLMREGEPKGVVTSLERFGVKTKLLSVRSRFFRSLKGKIGPEKKRKVFREIFYRVLGEAVRQERTKFLIQGTIKADIIETVGGVKTQHNVLEQIGINPQKYGLQIIEPLKGLYKPDVRLVAKSLGLPREVYRRMPFPGPGLATRIVGEVTPKKVKIVRQATKIVEGGLEKYSPFQMLAVLLSDRATGIEKGKRIFGNILVIRSVDSQNAITASVTKIPLISLNRLRKKLIEEIPGISRVLFDLTPKPPATIEYI